MPLCSDDMSARSEYGDRVSLATRESSTQNSTRRIPLADDALAENRIDRPTVELATGAVRVTVGPAGVVVAAGLSSGAATVHVALAPGSSTLPAASVDRTSTRCVPMLSPETRYGLAQALHAPPSRRHSEVAPPSFTVNVTEPLSDRDSSGGDDVIVVCGATVSTLNERVAGDASVLPAASVARTLTV
jgi:hypothetical protein